VLSPTELSALELRLALEPGSAADYVVRAPSGDAAVTAGSRVALREAEGVLLAVLDVAQVAGDGSTISGRLRGVRFPAHPDAPGLRRTPSELREEVERRGWRSVHGVLTDRPLFDADLARIRDRLISGDDSAVDGVVVCLLAGGVAATDPEHHTRLAALRAGLATLPRDRVLLTVLPLPRAAGPDERRRIAAGWGLRDADVEPAPGSPSDATVLAALERPDGDAGTEAGLVPAEVLAALRRTHRPRAEQGFTVFFTGLSGSGKSTVAGLLAVRLLELTTRSVLLLDGDRVRRHLTAGLGFSQADRDTNVRRIGWVAAQVSAAGGIAVCAPIAPYDGTRRQVRAMVEGSSPSAGFVLVHIATPLEECERRDRKGLYAKARAGELPGFTGISDPYEVPQDAEVVADTTGREPADVVDEIVRYLVGAGYLGQPAPIEAITS
jgi:sulfate adenylyltransferase